jgi:DNA-binding beta-propeller fold protein YncE
MAIDPSGNVFVADYFNHRIRRIDGQTGIVTTVAGNGSGVSSGEGQAAIDAGVPYPYALAVDSLGNLFIIENGTFKVRKVDANSGIIRTVAGTGHDGFSGDGGLATDADMNPVGIALDRQGNLYISDMVHNRIRRVDGETGVISTVAGNGLPRRKSHIE